MTHLRSVTGVGAAGLAERRLELAERLLRDAVTDTVVGVDDDALLLLRGRVDDLSVDGRDLLLELAGGLGAERALLRLGRERVLLLAGDVVRGGDVLTCAGRVARISLDRYRARETEREGNALVIPMGSKQSAACGLARTFSDICTTASERQ